MAKMGGWKIFKVSLHSWQVSANALFYEDPLYCLSPLFQMLFTPLNLRVTFNPTFTVLSVVMFL